MKFGSRLLCVFSILLLAACHGESGAPPSPGDTASTAPAPIVSTAVTTSIPLDNVPINNSAPVKIAFSVPGSGSATGLTVTTGLASLPSGWSGTSPSFSCATVDANNPCELTLTYNHPGRRIRHADARFHLHRQPRQAATRQCRDSLFVCGRQFRHDECRSAWPRRRRSRGDQYDDGNVRIE